MWWHRPEWTPDTLLTYWKDRHIDLQGQMEQRLTAQQAALEAAIRAQRDTISAAIEAMREATAKSEHATDLRFDNASETQKSIVDRIGLLITRAESEKTAERNLERIQELSVAIRELAGKKDLLNAYERIDARLLAVEKAITASEGKSAGLAAGWGWIASAIAIVASAITTYFILKHGGTTH